MEQLINIGLPVHGDLHEGTDASGGLEVPLYTRDGNGRPVGSDERLAILHLNLVTAAGGDSYLFSDLDGLSEAILAASTADDTLAIAGDWTAVLEVGDKFYVHGSTGNDGEYTITSLAYDSTNNRTTIGVASVANGTADGNLATTYYPVAAADASGNTFTIAGDVRSVFPVGRLFKVDGSTGNDNSGNNYTVTATNYDASADQTTISVSSVADGTDDGFIIPQPTAFAGKRLIRGTYGTNGGNAPVFTEPVELEDGHTLYGVAPAGVADFEVNALLRKTIAKS